MPVLFFIIAISASLIGAICGIGGGVIMKPLLDLLQAGTVAQISFLSSCSVLAMSAYSVSRNILGHTNLVQFKTGTPLAIGAALGGMLGSQIFSALKNSLPNPDLLGAIQSGLLFLMTVGCLIYTLKKSSIHTLTIDSFVLCLAIGLVLGMVSSFLGIGGGPLNLIVLSFFLSLPAKTAAQNSLYIILVSQIFNIGMQAFNHTIPAFEPLSLILMIAGGLAGGMGGRKIASKISNQKTDQLFIGAMVVIMLICVYNCIRYMG